jgi:hypothetical protein
MPYMLEVRCPPGFLAPAVRVLHNPHTGECLRIYSPPGKPFTEYTSGGVLAPVAGMDTTVSVAVMRVLDPSVLEDNVVHAENCPRKGGRTRR